MYANSFIDLHHGSISVAISHASGYIITDEEIEIPAGNADTDGEPADSNPGTGVALAGTAVLALISAATVATTAKKRK